MKSAKKTGIIVLVIILNMVSNLSGETGVMGDFLIPDAEGGKAYRCVIVITQQEIVFECNKRIFQPFNLFEAPKQTKIQLSMSLVTDIEIHNKSDMIYITTHDSFYIRYKNYFNAIYDGIWMPKEGWALLCIIDKHSDTLVLGKELKRIIGARCRIID
jgi:hypothetical protein